VSLFVAAANIVFPFRTRTAIDWRSDLAQETMTSCRLSLTVLVYASVVGLARAMDGPRLAENLPTPWMGIYERINIYGHLQWVVVLPIALWRVRNTATPDDFGGRCHSR
jgi:hypothetical protein